MLLNSTEILEMKSINSRFDKFYAISYILEAQYIYITHSVQYWSNIALLLRQKSRNVS